MAFRCPECHDPSSLEIITSIDLPADSRSDEIILQVLACSSCGFKGLGVYEESRRGALDSEAWEHTGFRVPAGVLDDLLKAIASCPGPSNAGCGCAAHLQLGRQDASGRWPGPQALGLQPGAVFELVIGSHSEE
jgi:hypothetical protein